MHKTYAKLIKETKLEHICMNFFVFLTQNWIPLKLFVHESYRFYYLNYRQTHSKEDRRSVNAEWYTAISLSTVFHERMKNNKKVSSFFNITIPTIIKYVKQLNIRNVSKIIYYINLFSFQFANALWSRIRINLVF